MAATAARAGRRGDPPAAGAVRGSRSSDPILRRVVAVAVLAAVLATVVVAGFPSSRGVLDGIAIPGGWLLPVLTAVTCLGELTVVRLRHRDATEELTLCEAAIIVDVLLLPARQALAAAVLGLLIATVLQRRPPVKAAFNLATYTAGVSGLIAIVHLVGGTPGEVTGGVVAGVVLGTFAFAAINLGCLAQILALISGVRPSQVVREQARLSAYMALGSVATGLPAAAIAIAAPVLLPFMAMPALAVTFAYRAAAQESVERARSAVLLRLSHAMASRDDVIRRFVGLVREAFDADFSLVVLDGAAVAVSVDGDLPDAPTSGPVPGFLATHRRLDRPVLVTAGLPPGLRQALIAPLAGGGHRYGIVVLGVRRRRQGRLATRDLTVLSTLASELATAISAGEHLDRLLAETSKLQAIAEQAAEGILMVDGAGTVQMWSRAFTDLTAISREDATGKRLTELLDVPDEQERRLLMPVSVGHPKVAVEMTILRPDGELRRLRLAHSAVFAGEALVRDVVVAIDLTREHRNERLKSDFIATVSHELRTPLTPIIGYLALLRTRGEQMTPKKRDDCLDLLADRAAHMSRLVEDLLISSRVDGADADLTLQVDAGTHDLAALVRQAVRDIDTSRVRVSLPAHPVPARCDDGRTLQVVTNLVGNALKYSPESESVRVEMELAGDRARVRVTDSGLGIPVDQVDKVFDKFHRVEDPMTMSTSGTGLGLFIARRLARAMGGDIDLVSTLTVGSVFTLTLPLAEPPVPPSPIAATAPSTPAAPAPAPPAPKIIATS